MAAARFEDLYSRTKLASGLVLFVFLATHLINHTLGIVSLQAMDAGAAVFKSVWRSWPGTVLLYAAAVTHPLLALFSWLRRGHYRGIAWQGWVQLALGLCVPPLVVDHVIGTRGLHEAMGVNDSYAYVLIVQFVQEPLIGLRQNILILIAWGHGCIGAYYWLRLKQISERLWPVLFGLALLLPMLATMGYLSAGRAVLLAMQQPEWLDAFRAGLNWPGPMANDFGMRNVDYAYQGMIGLLALGLLGRMLAALLRRRRGIVTVSYPDGRKFRGLAGNLTVLEASRAIGYPHASVCGGQGRCSTCRRPMPPSRRCSTASGHRRACGSPARCGRATISPCCRCCRPACRRASSMAPVPTRKGRSGASPSCSPICAASPSCRKASCPMTWCSC